MKKALIENNLTGIYTTDIKGYSNLLVDDYKQFSTNFQKSEVMDTVVNDMSARLLSMKGQFENVDIFY